MVMRTILCPSRLIQRVGLIPFTKCINLKHNGEVPSIYPSAYVDVLTASNDTKRMVTKQTTIDLEGGDVSLSRQSLANTEGDHNISAKINKGYYL
jgi:hypothetical protein